MAASKTLEQTKQKLGLQICGSQERDCVRPKAMHILCLKLHLIVSGRNAFFLEKITVVMYWKGLVANNLNCSQRLISWDRDAEINEVKQDSGKKNEVS